MYFRNTINNNNNINNINIHNYKYRNIIITGPLSIQSKPPTINGMMMTSEWYFKM